MVWVRQLGEVSGALPPDSRNLSHRASGLGRQPGGSLPVTLTVRQTLRCSGCFPVEPCPPKGSHIVAQTGPGNGDFSRPTEEGFKLSSGTQNGV
jgi:hypothetical protein